MPVFLIRCNAVREQLLGRVRDRSFVMLVAIKAKNDMLLDSDLSGSKHLKINRIFLKINTLVLNS